MARATRNAVASSSRQRQATSQPNGISDDERASKPPTVNGSSRADGRGHAGDDEDEDETVDEKGWTVETFKNLALSRHSVNSSELRSLIDKCVAMQDAMSQAIERGVDTAKYLEDCSPDDEHIDTLDQKIRQCIEDKEIIGLRIKALQSMEADLFRNEEAFTDAVAAFIERSAELEQSYMAQTTRKKFKNSKDYIAFRSDLWEVNHDKEAAPPVTNWLPREEGDEESDEDFEIGGQTQQYRCPLTLRTFTDAVVSSKCGHHYDRDAITNLINQSGPARRGPAACDCPRPGCKEKITEADLRTDKQLQKRADEYEARRKRREAQEADGEDEDITEI